MIASSESMNGSKNMPRFSSNNMVHNHYLDEARKKTQERDRNSKTSMIPFARFQSTADDSKPKPRSTNHSTRSLPVSKSSCITIAVVPISTGHRFSHNKTSAVYEKTSPRSDLRWKPTGRIFKIVGLSAGTSINVQKEQSFNLSAGTSSNVKPDNLKLWLLKKMISETSVEVDSKLINKMTFEQNGSSLAPQSQQKLLKQI
ncbi:hypothetical protein Tco_0955137 [Tanacetum coccineum]|uniref:Uncharacterized protein n=1 Tax=Tanacetum coccineum TaxID=301880 RepID=A0ABQ5E6G5_9ASTR